MQRIQRLMTLMGMGSLTAILTIALNFAWASLPAAAIDPTALPLRPVTLETLLPASSAPTTAATELPLGIDPAFSTERQQLLQSIRYSLNYLSTPAAIAAYRDYPIAGISHDRMRRSLVRFRQLVHLSPSAEALWQAVQREFQIYQSIGNDGDGTVGFTGYFEPTYSASRVPTDTYRYPLYRRPPTLDQWPQPHPSRAALEGTDGLQSAQGKLNGLELVWLKDRLEAFLVQVQGSARLQLTDGSIMTVGYAGRTDYEYTSIGRELINDGIIPEADLSLPVLLDYFEQNPGALDRYIPRNQRFVFFRETNGAPPIGNLSVPVTPGRSIATDRSLMPPGGLALLHMPIPHRTETGDWAIRQESRFVLDQDTGGAIRGPGRVDLFIGTGEEAGLRAGRINGNGTLYYLLLR